MKFANKTALAGLALCSGITASAWDLKLSENHTVQFHGFASQGALASTDYDYLGKTTETSGKFGELGVNATYSPFARTRISLQGFAFTVGEVGEYKPFLDYAQVDYSFSDAFGVRAGRIRRPEGIYNHIQDVDLARTSVLLPQGMYDARYRDFSASIDGGSLYGTVGLGKGGDLSYEVYGGAVGLSEKGGIARLLQDSFSSPVTSYDSVNGFPQAGVQLWWNTPLDGFRVGAAVTKAFGFSYDYNLNLPPAMGGGFYRAHTDALKQHYSLEYAWNNWTFQAEYLFQVYKNHSDLNGTTISYTQTPNDSWYVGASYRATSWMEIGTYYSETYADTRNRHGSGTATPSNAYQKDLTLSLRFDPTAWWIVKLEGHYIHGTSLLQNTANNPVAARNDDGWFMFAAKTTFSF